MGTSEAGLIEELLVGLNVDWIAWDKLGTTENRPDGTFDSLKVGKIVAEGL